MGHMVRALMHYPERTTAELAEAAGRPARAANPVAVRLGAFALTPGNTAAAAATGTSPVPPKTPCCW